MPFVLVHPSSVTSEAKLSDWTAELVGLSRLLKGHFSQANAKTAATPIHAGKPIYVYLDKYTHLIQADLIYSGR